jgi:hypothetical protein
MLHESTTNPCFHHWDITSMESPNETNAHKKSWKGNFPQMESPGKLGVKDLGWKLSKVSLGHERGFKILPDNDAKMLSHKL